jgi:16S rRNA C1402 (ribose-2'-O) methylase RsmI
VREGTIPELRETCSGKNRGEMVLILHGNEEKIVDKPEGIDQLILWYRDQQRASLKTAVAAIAEDLQISRTKVYQRALGIWKNGDGDK